MDYKIRRAGAGDAEALSAVARAAFLEAFAGLISGADILARLRDQESEAAFAGWLAADRAALWLAEIDAGGAPIGYAGLAAPMDLGIEPDATDIELKRIYVLHRFHGAGVAQALVEAAIAHAAASGAGRVLLGVKDDNLRAIGFYKRNGFAEIGVRQFRVGDHFYNDLVLARPLG